MMNEEKATLNQPLLTENGVEKSDHMVVNGMPTGGAMGHLLKYTPVDDIEKMADSVRQFFNTGATRSLEWRLQQLKALKRMLTENRQDFVDCIVAQFGNAGFMQAAEVEVCIRHIDHAIYHLPYWVKNENVEFDIVMVPAQMYYHYEPYGVVCMLSPWNYPFQLAVLPIIGALAAGNCVVIKPSELAPHSAVLLEKLLPSYVDSRAIRVIQGSIEETTKLLSLKFDLIFFTGSSHVGKIVMAAAAKHLTPTVLELGGKCPVYLAPDCDFPLAVRRLVTTKYTWNSGQTCVTPDYVMIQQQNYDEFVQLVKKTIYDFYGPEPEKSGDLFRIINLRNLKRLTSMLDDDTIQILHGGKSDESKLWLEPTVVLAKPESKCMQDELFGPLLPIIIVRNHDEAIQFINNRPKPLGAYLFTYDKKLQQRFEEGTSSGALVFNDCGIQSQSITLGFGGVGDSGMGQYHGQSSFACFSHRKPVVRKLGKNDKMFRHPPITEKHLKRIQKIPAIYGRKIQNCCTMFFLIIFLLVAAGIAYGIYYAVDEA